MGTFWQHFQGRQEDGEPENKKPSLEEDTEERHRLVAAFKPPPPPLSLSLSVMFYTYIFFYFQ